LIRQVKRQMLEYASQLRFEQASSIKRHMELLEGALESQVVERDVRHDQDVLHFEADIVLAIHVRRGVVCDCTWPTLRAPAPTNSCSTATPATARPS
jgi:excinuclease UvrABC nuclease subunit